jgi:hypothetical protein
MSSRRPPLETLPITVPPAKRLRSRGPTHPGPCRRPARSRHWHIGTSYLTSAAGVLGVATTWGQDSLGQMEAYARSASARVVCSCSRNWRTAASRR